MATSPAEPAAVDPGGESRPLESRRGSGVKPGKPAAGGEPSKGDREPKASASQRGGGARVDRKTEAAVNWWTRMMGQRGKRKRSAKSADSRRREIQRRVAEAGERCIPELLVDLTDDWVVVREAAAAGLGKLKAVAALGPLAERVREDTNVDVRRVAANSLGLIGDPGAVGALLDLAIERNRLGGVALENLARLGRPAVPLLVKALADESEPRRLGAIEALGRIGDTAAVRPLLKLFPQSKGEQRQKIVESLGALGDRSAAGALAEALGEGDVGLQRAALVGLGRVSAPESVEKLTKLLTHNLAELRGLAARALAKAGASRHAVAIAGLLGDAGHEVRLAAVEALRQLGVATATRVRTGLLGALEDDHADVREAASRAVGELGLLEGLEGLCRQLHDDYAAVRRAAAEALGALGEPAGLKAFSEFFEKEGDLENRLAAIRAVGRIGDPQGLEVLKPLLEAPEATVRARTVVALGELGGGAACEAMLPALRDPSSEVRYHAAVSLGHLAEPGTLSALAVLLDDDDPFVLRGLVRATGQFQGAKAVALRASAEERLKALEVTRREREQGDEGGEASSERGPGGMQAVSRALANPQLLGGAIAALLLLLGGWWFWPAGKPRAIATSAELTQAGSARRSDHLVGVGMAADGSAVVVTQSGRVELWDPATGELRKNVGGAPEPVSAAAVSSKGTLVALAEPIGRLRVLELPEGSERLSLAMRPGVISRMKFSEDGARLVSVAPDGLVKLLDLKTGKWDEEVRIEGFAEVQAWALDGDLKRVGMVRRNGDVLVQQLAAGRRAVRVPVQTEGLVTALAFGRDRRQLALVDVTQTLRLYDLTAKQIRKELRGGGPGTVRLLFSADGKRILGGGAEGVTFWDLEAESGSVVSAELKVEKRREFLEMVDLLSLDESGRWLIGGSTAGPHALVWNAQSKQVSSPLAVN